MAMLDGLSKRISGGMSLKLSDWRRSSGSVPDGARLEGINPLEKRLRLISALLGSITLPRVLGSISLPRVLTITGQGGMCD
jgi:hypothetical protein